MTEWGINRSEAVNMWAKAMAKEASKPTVLNVFFNDTPMPLKPFTERMKFKIKDAIESFALWMLYKIGRID